MSDEQRITKVEKEKDPRRVEAGRKLGAASKAAREKKAKQRTEEEEQTTSEEAESAGDYSVTTILMGVGVLSGLVCLYFRYRQDQRLQIQNTTKSNCEVSEQQSKPLSDSIPRKPCKLHSLDD